MMRLLTVVASSIATMAVPANASVLYTSGAIDGNYNAIDVNHNKLTSSFTLSSDSTVTGFTFGGWSSLGNVITAISWGISATPDFRSDTNTALTSDGRLPNTYPGYEIREYAGTLSPLVLAAGTYWLTLHDATTSNNSPAYWDVNDGNTISYGNQAGAQIHSLSFSILGSAVSAVPELSTWAMMIGGFAMTGVAMRRRRTLAVAIA